METTQALTDLLRAQLGNSYSLFSNLGWIGAELNSISRWLFRMNDNNTITGVDSDFNDHETHHLSDPDLLAWMVQHTKAVLG